MEETKGIDNPAFIPSSSNLQQHSPEPPAEGEVSKLPSQPISSEEQGASAPPPPKQQEHTQSPELEEGLCGWGNFTPSYLQRWNNPKGFLFHYCLLALTQGQNQQQRLEVTKDHILCLFTYLIYDLQFQIFKSLLDISPGCCQPD